MTTVYDIPADIFIRQVADELKSVEAVHPPDWAAFAKTGVHKQMPPEDPEWWYIRAAAILRRVYIDGPVGVQRMRTFYGGKKDRGSRRYQFRKGSGSIIRVILQQLETAGFVEQRPDGRRVTAAGRAFLDRSAHGLKMQAQESVPASGMDE
ncbi:MAG: 30S ribosomal protein S19e [Methanomicrobiales archaeon]